jgi:hypothetical protein
LPSDKVLIRTEIACTSMLKNDGTVPKASLLLCYCYAGLSCSREIPVASFGPFFAKECWQRKYRHNPDSPIH